MHTPALSYASAGVRYMGLRSALRNICTPSSTRPTLQSYLLTREELLSRAGAVLSAIERGELKLQIEKTLPLAEAARAHELLASRKTSGKLLLLP